MSVYLIEVDDNAIENVEDNLLSIEGISKVRLESSGTFKDYDWQ